MPHRLQLDLLQVQDHAGVQALFARQGWPQRSLAGWRWALFDAPQRPAADSPAGWVLRGPGGVVGFLGNLPQRLWQDGQPLPAATCTALLVEPEWRGQGAALLRAFSAQSDVRLLYSATANVFSGPLYALFRFEERSEPGLNQSLRWVAHGGAFAGHALRQAWLRRRRAAPAGPGEPAPSAGRPRPVWAGGPASSLLRPARALLGWPAVPAAGRAAGSARIRRWHPADTGTAPAQAHDLRQRWQAWWSRMLAAHGGLLADRQQDTLAWRLADPDAADSLALWLALDEHEDLLGLALARAVAPAAPAAPRAELLDWCLLPSTPGPAQAALLAAVGRWAMQRGLPFVEARRCSGLALQQLARLGGRAVPLPAQANWTRARPGAEAVADPSRWSMSGIDSDDWFCSHPAPPPGASAGG
jgi:GNAT superfamily N-acetyltransferase